METVDSVVCGLFLQQVSEKFDWTDKRYNNLLTNCCILYKYPAKNNIFSLFSDFL